MKRLSLPYGLSSSQPLFWFRRRTALLHRTSTVALSSPRQMAALNNQIKA